MPLKAYQTTIGLVRKVAMKTTFVQPPKLSRRTALAGLAIGGGLALTGKMQGHEKNPAGKPVSLIVATDLFRPHDDPDDHWDLATAYALAFQGMVDLRAILIDFPRPNSGKDPDISAVSQLNYVTGLSVPVIVGSPYPYSPGGSLDKDQGTLRRFRALLQILEESQEPVVISIAGSCRDIATAARISPKLFAEKCAAVYLNAGASRPGVSEKVQLEWNVTLDMQAYQAMFELPCPVYWMPCFEDVRRFETAEFATYFRFQQGLILNQLRPSMRKFFAYVFETTPDGQKPASDWLRYLLADENQTLLSTIAEHYRNMWCTGGFIHAAGYSVTPEGELVSRQSNRPKVFEFLPIEIRKCQQGMVEWQPRENKQRFIFHVTDRDRYPTAMTKALLAVLSRLP